MPTRRPRGGATDEDMPSARVAGNRARRRLRQPLTDEDEGRA